MAMEAGLPKRAGMQVESRTNIGRQVVCMVCFLLVVVYPAELDWMRILVTGTSGQVGGALVSRLQGFGLVMAPDEVEFPTSHSRLRFQGHWIASNRTSSSIRPPTRPLIRLRMSLKSRCALTAKPLRCLRDGPRVTMFRSFIFQPDYVFNGAGDPGLARSMTRHSRCRSDGSSKLAGENAVRAAGGTSLVIRTSWVYAGTVRHELFAGHQPLGSGAHEFAASLLTRSVRRHHAAVIADGVTEMLSRGLDKFQYPLRRKPTDLFSLRGIRRDQLARLCIGDCRRV